MEFICNGSRDSQWFYDGKEYVRVFKSRNGSKTKTYSKAEVENLPNKNIEEVIVLKAHCQKI